MLELLKKIGLPATVSAVIAALITAIPLLLKIDERYAKEDQLKAEVTRTTLALNSLAIEIGKLAGSQDALVAIIAGQEVRHRKLESAIKPRVTLRTAPSAPEPLEEVSRDLRTQQTRVLGLITK